MGYEVSKKTKAMVFLLGGLLAAAAFVCIYGFRVLIPTYDDWLLFSRDGVDNMQHYQGWVAYRHSSWQFPIGLIEGIIYPDRISIIYTDSAPLFAFVFKLLSPVLPDTFQYFGIFGLLCAFLLGAFASELIFHFSDNAVYSVISSLFFATAFVFLHRMFYHTALSAQWIVIASLYLWLAVGYDRIKRQELSFGIKRVVLWTLLSAVALLTEAYFLPMVWGIMLCDLIRYGLISGSLRDLLSAAAVCMLPAASVTILLGWCFGLFYGEVDSTGLGLGVYTFNLINFFNPFWMSSILPWLPSDFFQYEGLAYLGLGILCLAPFAAGLWCKGISDKKKAKVGEYRIIGGDGEEDAISICLPLALFFTGFLVAAVSPTISFGDYRVTIPIPDALAMLWSTFRSSGRLIWPVYYLLILLILMAFGRFIKNKRLSVIILIAAFVLQMADAHGFILDLHEKFAPEHVYVSSLSDPAWEKLARDHEHIAICPDTHDIYYTYEGEELEYYALTNGLTMNIVYTARVVSDQVNERMRSQLDDISSGLKMPDEKTIYVFLDGKKDKSLPLYYYKLNGYLIGVAQPL